MSYALKQAAQIKFAEAIGEITDILVERTGDSLDQMRVNQGVIFGLRRAGELLDDALKEMMGE